MTEQVRVDYVEEVTGPEQRLRILHSVGGPALEAVLDDNDADIEDQPHQTSETQETKDKIVYQHKIDLDIEASAQDSVRLYINAAVKIPLLDAVQEVELAKQIEAGLLAEKIVAFRRQCPTDQISASLVEQLDPAVLAVLVRYPASRMPEYLTVVEQGKAAFSYMVSANLRLVISIAKRYNGTGMKQLDAIQNGNLGLIHAVKKFDYTKGIKFSTYAEAWIRKEILRAMPAEVYDVYIPAHVDALARKRRSKILEFEQQQQDFTEEDVRLAIGVSKGAYDDMLQAVTAMVRLDKTIENDTGGNTTIGELVTDEGGNSFETVQDKREMVEALMGQIEALGPWPTAIISRRFGLNGGEPQSLAEIAAALKITLTHVIALESQAMRLLRTQAPHSGLRAFLEA